jgi:two-component system KDP operon response regulator KdpE
MKVLLIEDDENIAASISLCFEFRWPEAEVIATTEGTKGIEMTESESPDIIILDLNLPDIDGLDVLKQIRLFSDVPLIILTIRDVEMDKVKGLEMGADDYIVKPFSALDLLARVKATLRRAGMRSLAKEDIPPFIAGNLTINFLAREVSIGGKPVRLTPTEYKLLYTLVRNKGRTVTHEALQRQVWGSAEYVDSSTVKKYIYQLRTKLGDTSTPPQMILSERGVGYKFVAPR